MLASLAAAQTASESATLERQFQEAIAAQDTGDLEKAETLLFSLHARHPGIFAVDESLGLVYVALEKYPEALPILGAAVHESPQSDIAHANLGAAYYKLHRNAEALKEFEDAARLNPQNASTQEALGRLQMEMHQSARAADTFAAALTLKPNDHDLMLAHAQALIDAGQLEQASKQLDAMPDVDSSAAAQSLLGDLEERAGGFRNAAEHYAKAVQLDPTESNVWALGVEFLRHWTFDAAAKEFEAAIIKFPNSSRMKLGLGAAAFGGGDYNRAIQVFSELLASENKNGTYAQMLGVACSAAAEGDHPQCAALIPYALAHPRDANTAVHAAAWLQKKSFTAENSAIERRLLENAIAADSKLAEAQYRMGLLQQNENQWAASVPYLETAVRLNTGFAEAHYRLGQAYWHIGHKQQAESEMEQYRQAHDKKMEDRDQKLSQITTLIVNMSN
jgi:tetratricopeptide (TPR) repeat protein